MAEDRRQGPRDPFGVGLVSLYDRGGWVGAGGGTPGLPETGGVVILGRVEGRESVVMWRLGETTRPSSRSVGTGEGRVAEYGHQ